MLVKNPDTQILSEMRASMFYHELESDNVETMVLNMKTSTYSVRPEESQFHDSSKRLRDFGRLTKKPKSRKLKKLEEIERVRKKVLSRIENHKKLILRPKHIHNLNVPESPLN